MVEESILLKDSVQWALIGRKRSDILSFKENASGIGFLKTSEYAQEGGLPAARRTQKRQELILPDVQIQLLQDRNLVKRF